jgi:hypothetical protein
VKRCPPSREIGVRDGAKYAVDNVLMLAIPGAMDAPIDSAFFWTSMGTSLAAAGLAPFPVSRWLNARGSGHAVVHAHHGARK